jgi:hypothetical protein
MLKFSRKNLQASHETPWLVLDLVMLGLLLLNLLLLIFDSLYTSEFFKSGLNQVSPWLVSAYQPIHQNFTLIDLGFIAIFLSEFCLRWIVAIYRKEHLRWYFFPVIHWYDLIGCIPISGLRIFRFLRIFSILYRLNKYQIVDLRSTALFRFIAFYYDVFVEELSDRIVVKVISDAQKDIAAGSPLLHEISTKVIASRQAVLCEWVASMSVHIGESIEHNEHGETVRQHVKQSVGKAVRGNAQIGALRLVPMLGSTIEKTLEQSVTDIVTHSIINLLKDITPQKVDHFVEQGFNTFTSAEQNLDQEVLLVVNECLELVKEHAARQRWKEELQAKAELGKEAKAEGNVGKS